MHPHSTTGADSLELEGCDSQPDYSDVTFSVGSARNARVTLATLLATAAEPLKFLINGLIPWATVIVLVGAAKLARKTWFAMAAALAVARGESFIGRPTARMPVIYAFLEDGRRRAALRFQMLGARGNEEIRLEAVFGPRDALRLLEELRTRGERVFLVIDPLVVLLAATGVKDENAALEIEKCFALLRELVAETGSSVLMTHHTRKSGDRMRGSVAIGGSCDGWIELKRNKDGTADLTGTLRDCDGPNQRVQFRFDAGRACVEPAGDIDDALPSPEELDSSAMAVLELMRAEPLREWREAEVTSRLSLPRGKGRGALQRLIGQGHLLKVGDGAYRLAASDHPASASDTTTNGTKRTKKRSRKMIVELE